MTETGYFASLSGNRSGVHVVRDRKPICGYAPARRMRFQLCAMGVHEPYVSCKKCRVKAAEGADDDEMESD
jgi:hypothetical protein